MKKYQIVYTYNDIPNQTDIVEAENKEEASDTFKDMILDGLRSADLPSDTDIYDYYNAHYSINAINEY